LIDFSFGAKNKHFRRRRRKKKKQNTKFRIQNSEYRIQKTASIKIETINKSENHSAGGEKVL
jgi:hypothetical protein